jgi:hypothetical protein
LQCAQPAAALSALWRETVNGWLEAGLNDRAQYRQVIATAAETQSVTTGPSRANQTVSMISYSEIGSAVYRYNRNSVHEISLYRLMDLQSEAVHSG